jgi:hypothetical protein
LLGSTPGSRCGHGRRRGGGARSLSLLIFVKERRDVQNSVNMGECGDVCARVCGFVQCSCKRSGL